MFIQKKAASHRMVVGVCYNTNYLTISVTMEITRHQLSLHELAEVLESALPKNYVTSSTTVVDCPNLRESPFSLACEGLSGCQVIADIGVQPSLFPQPRLDEQYSLIVCVRLMGLDPEQGAVVGAGAGPIHVHGTNSEIAPNLSWQGGFGNVDNLTRAARLVTTLAGGRTRICCPYSDSTECLLMMSLYGSMGLPGPVLKVTARGQRGESNSFTEFMRSALQDIYGEN